MEKNIYTKDGKKRKKQKKGLSEGYRTPRSSINKILIIIQCPIVAPIFLSTKMKIYSVI